MKIDVHFIEFYLFKKYGQKLEDYYNVNKSVASKWRNKSFPERRMDEFKWREGTDDLIELLNRIY
jgi:hypothetical protein